MHDRALADIDLPDAVRVGTDGEYFHATLREVDRLVRVYIRNRNANLEVVGIERD